MSLNQQPLMPEVFSYHPLPVVGWRQCVIEKGGTYERRAILAETIECQKCGGRVELWRETEEWIQNEIADQFWWPEGPRWVHQSYGPVAGFCEDCPTAYHDGFDGMFMIDLSETTKPEPKP